MNKRLRILLVVLAVATVVVWGAFREFVFVNINEHLKFVYWNYEQSYAHSMFHFLNQYSYERVYFSKWWLTFLFSLGSYILTLFILGLLYPRRNSFFVTSIFYGVLIFVSIICFGFGWISGFDTEGYRLSRVFMGYAQSPVPLMILIPAFFLQYLPDTQNSRTE